eukprot:2054304-Rhodomonas_salina.2
MPRIWFARSRRAWSGVTTSVCEIAVDEFEFELRPKVSTHPRFSSRSGSAGFTIVRVERELMRLMILLFHDRRRPSLAIEELGEDPLLPTSILTDLIWCWLEKGCVVLRRVIRSRSGGERLLEEVCVAKVLRGRFYHGAVMWKSTSFPQSHSF